MLIKEFISETNKNQMIAVLLKNYKVGNVKLQYTRMKDYAHFDVDRGVLKLSTRYKKIQPSETKEFLITIIHEIYHAMDAKRLGWKNFKTDYEMEMNYLVQQGKDEYKDNKFEIAAEKFGRKNWKKWYKIFKKDGLL